MLGARATLSHRRMAQQPFRDERAAALVRVDALERELARTRAELAATQRKLARRPRWTDAAIRGAIPIAALFVIFMGLATLFAGCHGCSQVAHFVNVSQSSRP